MKRVASDWEVAGRADETGHVPGLFQGIHDLLWRKDIKLNTFESFLYLSRQNELK